MPRRKSGSAVISGYRNDGVLEPAGLLQLVGEDSQDDVKSMDLPEIVGQVLANFGYVRKKRRHLALEFVRINVPK